MTSERSDALLITWVIVSTLWDFAMFGFVFYLIFWKGRSAGWLIFAALMTYSPSLFKALKKRFGLPEND